MELLKSEAISCPYCGESLDIAIDCSVDYQSYIEDCQVCCRPIVLHVSVDEAQNVQVTARHEDEGFMT